jgi:hypothetical protein
MSLSFLEPRRYPRYLQARPPELLCSSKLVAVGLGTPEADEGAPEALNMKPKEALS